MFPGGSEGRIERLRFKKGTVAGKVGVRFSWWKNDKMAPRPLDVSEDELLKVMKDSIQQGVF